MGRFKYIFPQNNQIYPVNFASKVKRNTAASFISIYRASFLKYLPILPGNLKNSHSTISQNYWLSDDCCWLLPSQMHICFLSPCLPTHSLFISYILCKVLFLSSLILQIRGLLLLPHILQCEPFLHTDNLVKNSLLLVLQADWTSVSAAL